MKKKDLALIEELKPDSEYLTDDTDLAAKHNETINQIMFELARLKKIPKYVEIKVSAGDVITFEDIARACGYEIYQVSAICGVQNVSKAQGTVFKMLESGTAEIDVFVYPERITEKTKDKAYEFELSADVLEIMPYGVAADLLKSDRSANFGKIYESTYESKKQMIDPRYHLPSVSIEGGYYI